MDAYPLHTGDNPNLERRVLRDSVYELLLEMLLQGRVAAGSPLGIESLARQLKVSPTPVREAMVQLEHTGLVTRTALKGYRVAPPLSAQQVVELLDARTLLEVAAAERAGRDIDALLPALRAAHNIHLNASTEVSADSGEQHEIDFAKFQRYFAADWGFHLVILQHSGNRFMVQMAESFGNHVHRMRQQAHRGISDVHQAIGEHAAILTAYEQHDAPAAVDAMRRHLEAVLERAIAEA